MRITITLTLMATLLSVAPHLHAQSLADLARQESERRKASSAPKGKGPDKVYTNKDLKPVIAPEPTSTASAASTGAGAPADPGTATKAPAAAEAKPSEVKDETYWRKRSIDLKAKLEEDRILADALQSRVNALTMDFVNRDNPVERSRIEADRQRALAELDRMNKAVTADQKAIRDFEEEARSSGITPGWLR
jgi:hypothetical protein